MFAKSVAMACEITELRAALARATVAGVEGEIVVTKTQAGQIVAVTRQDSEGRILKVIAESASVAPVPNGWHLVPSEPVAYQAAILGNGWMQCAKHYYVPGNPMFRALYAADGT
jgi:hypothetical protein